MESRRPSRNFAGGLAADRRWHAFPAYGNSTPVGPAPAKISTQAMTAGRQRRFRSSSPADCFCALKPPASLPTLHDQRGVGVAPHAAVVAGEGTRPVMMFDT
jgi:hypothetical protein